MAIIGIVETDYATQGYQLSICIANYKVCGRYPAELTEEIWRELISDSGRMPA
jgi:hypothetical protein